MGFYFQFVCLLVGLTAEEKFHFMVLTTDIYGEIVSAFNATIALCAVFMLYI